jgi:hypothetical protein
MKTSRVLQMLTSLAIVAVLVCGQQAHAQDNHPLRFSRIIVPQSKVDNETVRPAASPTPNLYPLQASFAQDYPVIDANADKSDLWPCTNQYQGIAGSDPDCPTLGDPSVPLPFGALINGFPAYSWPLENKQGVGNGFGCDALVNGTTGPLPAQYNPCGEIFTAYEDDTNDSTDDLLQRVVVTQGTSVIYDSGTVDYGPAGPTVSYPVSVILNYDANFGFWPGASDGPNNGNCSANYRYPLASPAFPGGSGYVVEAGKTCQQPVPGLATFKTFTALATPTYTQTTGERCTSQGVASPCYTVKWVKKYEIRQDWNIFLN